MKSFRRPGKDQGSAAVEFALILPLLLLIIFAIIDFGRMLNAKITLSQAAHEGARAAAIVDQAQATATVNEVMGSMSGDIEQITIGECDGTSEYAQVEVTYRFSYATPLGVFGGFGDAEGTTLSSTAVVPCL